MTTNPAETSAPQLPELSSLAAWAGLSPEQLLHDWGRYVGLDRETPRERIADVALQELRVLETQAPERQSAKGELLRARLHWLERGTRDSVLAALHPERDSHQILHHVFNAFRVEGRVLETVAINRIAQATDLLVLVRSTGKAESDPVVRFFDTYGLLANYFEWGPASERGRAAIDRLRAIHGRYFIPNEGMKYILLQTAFTWIEAARRIGHRPLLDLEQRAFVHAYVELGVKMGVKELEHDYERMQAWYLDFNRRHAGFHPIKRDTLERILGNSLTKLPTALARVVRLAVRAGMDDEFRSAVGEPAVSPQQLSGLRALISTLAHDSARLPARPWVRSVHDVPGRPPASSPDELGEKERSPSMPSIEQGKSNGGFPVGLPPVENARQLAELRSRSSLPRIPRDEVRRHASRESLWVIIDEEVYDLTSLAEAHPGGIDVLLRHAGADATKAYWAASHPQNVEILRSNYRIGVVE